MQNMTLDKIDQFTVNAFPNLLGIDCQWRRNRVLPL